MVCSLVGNKRRTVSSRAKNHWWKLCTKTWEMHIWVVLLSTHRRLNVFFVRSNKFLVCSNFRLSASGSFILLLRTMLWIDSANWEGCIHLDKWLFEHYRQRRRHHGSRSRHRIVLSQAQNFVLSSTLTPDVVQSFRTSPISFLYHMQKNAQDAFFFLFPPRVAFCSLLPIFCCTAWVSINLDQSVTHSSLNEAFINSAPPSLKQSTLKNAWSITTTI